jgi:type I restriction enzyme M protein
VAKQAKAKKEKSIEETLWESAVKLRGTVEPSEYKHVVFGLIFLKFASDKFEERRAELISEGKEKHLEVTDFYTMNNVFYIPKESRWTHIIKNGKQNDIAIQIDTALFTIEKNNPSLEGALPDNYYSRLNLDITKLSALLDTINKIDTLKDKDQDIIGRVYEYFLLKFAIAEGKGKGEFYTPKNIVNLIAELIEPYKGKIYDPCCGSGGMFVQSLKFIEAHSGNTKDVAIYGQEQTPTTYKLAKMNLAIRGISANLGDSATDTFAKDQHKDLKADFILANPPFNLKDWRGPTELIDDPRWSGYEVPPTSNANYGWILHMISKLSANGVAGFLLANGALGDSDTKEIRKKIIENDLVEAIIVMPRDMFYSTDISVTLWIINKNKKARIGTQKNSSTQYRDRSKEILFVDLRTKGETFEKKYMQLTNDDIKEVVTTYHNWQREGFETNYEDISEYCYSANIDEVKSNDWSLIPSKYIKFLDNDVEVVLESNPEEIKNEFKVRLSKELDSHKKLREGFNALGYKDQQEYETSLKELQLIVNTYSAKLMTHGELKRLGDYLEKVSTRNTNDKFDYLVGISEKKEFREPAGKVNRENLSNHIVLNHHDFAYIPRMNPFKPLAVALSFYNHPILISPSYVGFQIKDKDVLLPEFLFLFLMRKEFDRYAAFNAWSSTRDTFNWEDMCEVQIPLPDIDTQREIVAMHHVLETRKKLNEALKSMFNPSLVNVAPKKVSDK